MSPSASDVSVVTVNWNGRAHLAQLLPTLAAQGCREVIVVDNGSQDDSLAFLQREHPQVKVIPNPTNEGFAQPCNRGAEVAGGDLVAFVNNDMRVAPGWIDRALERMDDSTPCVASRILDWEGTHIDFNGSSLQYLGYALQRDSGRLAREVSHQDEILFPCGGAMLIRRDVFLSLGGFDADFFAIFEDVDLGWRLWSAGHRVALAPQSIVYHRGHATFGNPPDARMRYLMHRNALLTVLKNYEEEYVRKFFSAALVLSLSRAIRLSGAERESFYLWGHTRRRMAAGEKLVGEQLLDGLNHLVALEDVLTSLPHWLRKREAVQKLRQRSDRQILRLFGDPFRAIVEDPEYVDRELSLIRQLGLDQLWQSAAGAPLEAVRQGLPDILQTRLQRLKKELAAGQWLAGKAVSAPPPPLSSGWKAFLRISRQQGFIAAWKQFVVHMNRGI